MKKRVAVIGSGWRAETWIRLIESLPDYELAAVLVRNQKKADKFRNLGFRAAFSEEELFDKADLFLVCASKTENYSVCKRLLKKNAAVLCETPAGTDEEECAAFAALTGRLQIAEQYALRPHFLALRALIDRGYLGEVGTAAISCCHDYHAVSLIRRLLGTGREIPRISAFSLKDGYFETAGRTGGFAPRFREHPRTVALLRFGNKTGIYDFSEAQYFSEVRSNRILVQGTRGEISGDSGFRIGGDSAVSFRIQARYGGTAARLDVPELIDIVCDGEVLYENPLRGLRLSEEELAMADCLQKAAAYFDGGEEFYSASEAAFDASLALQIHRREN